jgi:hypothetical protein
MRGSIELRKIAREVAPTIARLGGALSNAWVAGSARPAIGRLGGQWVWTTTMLHGGSATVKLPDQAGSRAEVGPNQTSFFEAS